MTYTYTICNIISDAGLMQDKLTRHPILACPHYKEHDCESMRHKINKQPELRVLLVNTVRYINYVSECESCINYLGELPPMRIKK